MAVATAIKANIEGWVDAIDGVYAMAPMILGFYGGAPPRLNVVAGKPKLSRVSRNDSRYDQGL